MKFKKLRNMRDIPTIQGLKDRGVPSNREQIVSELARLEHEKARLERELSIWNANQRKTENRIHQVQERLNLLQNFLDELSPQRRRARQEEQPAEANEKTGNYREIPLEY